MMKAKDIRAMTAEARHQELEALQREQFTARMQKATGQLADSSRLKKLRRDIARLRTILRETQGGAA
jgi:large subunit ribosomal protein L29